MNAQTIFVTGTDTGVGKTRVTIELLRQLRTQGVDACGYKPVASGCVQTPQGLRNDDAEMLLAASGGEEAYARINPYAFEPAIAPHLAAQAAGIEIDVARLDAVHAELAARHAVIIVEGAGGWSVPLNAQQTFGDWVSARRWPVLLVVGMRLGCINHALLSTAAISRGTRLAGWVANALPPLMPLLDENVEALRQRIVAPLLARVAIHGEARFDLRSLFTDNPAALGIPAAGAP